MSTNSRNFTLLRVLNLIRFLRDGHRTVEDIANFSKCTKKTTYRDIRVLEEVGIPIIVERDTDIKKGNHNYNTNVYWIDRRWNL